MQKMPQQQGPHFVWDIKNEIAYLLREEGREESECIPVWSEVGILMPPATWPIWLVPDKYIQ